MTAADVIRLAFLALIVVAAIIAYPVVGAVLGGLVVLFFGTAWLAGRRRRRLAALPPAPVQVRRRRPVAPDVLAARKWAWQQLHGIERAHGLPLTRRRDGTS